MIPFILIGAMLVGILAAALESVSTSTSATGHYKRLPKIMLAQGEILFTRLRAPQSMAVRTTPAAAVCIAEASYGEGRLSRVVFVSLGGYLQKSQIIHDWVGTKSLIPPATPSYVVRIFDPRIFSVELTKNHYWNVIVNAKNGSVIGAFSYD